MKTAILWLLFVAPMDQWQGPPPLIQPTPRFETAQACQQVADKLDHDRMVNFAIYARCDSNDFACINRGYSSSWGFGIPKYRAWCERAEIVVHVPSTSICSNENAPEGALLCKGGKVSRPQDLPGAPRSRP